MVVGVELVAVVELVLVRHARLGRQRDPLREPLAVALCVLPHDVDRGAAHTQTITAAMTRGHKFRAANVSKGC